MDEGGWKPVFVMMEELEVAKLMYKLFDGVCDGSEELLKMLKE
jgi:hypothetical protein